MTDRARETEAIEATLADYFEGYRNRDRARLEKAFAVPAAHMKGYARNDRGELELVTWPITKIIDYWLSNEPNPDITYGKVLSVNLLGEHIATADFDCGGVYTDTFQLAKLDGRWRIVNKFYVDA